MVKSSNQTPSMNHCLETRPPPQAHIFSILLRNSMKKIRVWTKFLYAQKYGSLEKKLIIQNHINLACIEKRR